MMRTLRTHESHVWDALYFVTVICFESFVIQNNEYSFTMTLTTFARGDVVDSVICRISQGRYIEGQRF